MKFVIIIADGLGDEPQEELGGKTPLEYAFIPHIHYMATMGQMGRLQTVFPDFPIESMVCIMGLIGYNPIQFYPQGRASFEALAKGIPLNVGDLILRCNIIAIDPFKEIITDFTAGLISDSDARKVIASMKIPFLHWELYPGQSYRNILIIRDSVVFPTDIRCFEPHMNIGIPIIDVLPQVKNQKGQIFIQQLNDFLLDSRIRIDAESIGREKGSLMLWVWSPSMKPHWPSFFERTGLRAAFVGGLDFFHGIAMAANAHYDVIPGATGYIDTDYSAKAAATLKCLADYDFILTHVNATDEAAHQHNSKEKVAAIEKIDRLIIEPVLYELQNKFPSDYRLVFCGDHATRCSDGKHTATAVPYAVLGKGIVSSRSKCFGETQCAKHKPIPSLDFFSWLTSVK